MTALQGINAKQGNAGHWFSEVCLSQITCNPKPKHSDTNNGWIKANVITCPRSPRRMKIMMALIDLTSVFRDKKL